MNEHLVKFWLFATHWTELDTFDTEEELNDEIELLHRQNLPTKVRQRTKKDGGEELVLYVKQADRIMPATAPAGGPECDKEYPCQSRKYSYPTTLITAAFCGSCCPVSAPCCSPPSTASWTACASRTCGQNGFCRGQPYHARADAGRLGGLHAWHWRQRIVGITLGEGDREKADRYFSLFVWTGLVAGSCSQSSAFLPSVRQRPCWVPRARCWTTPSGMAAS